MSRASREAARERIASSTVGTMGGPLVQPPDGPNTFTAPYRSVEPEERRVSVYGLDRVIDEDGHTTSGHVAFEAAIPESVLREYLVRATEPEHRAMAIGWVEQAMTDAGTKA